MLRALYGARRRFSTACLRGIRQEPAISLGYSIAQLNSWLPSEGAQPRCVEQFLRRSVRFCGVITNVAVESDDVANERRQLGDGHILTPADINQLIAFIAFHQEDARIGE